MVKIRFTGLILIICVKLVRDFHFRTNALSRSKHHIIRTLNVYTEDFLRHLRKIFSVYVFMNIYFYVSCKFDVWDFNKISYRSKWFLLPNGNTRNHEVVVEKVTTASELAKNCKQKIKWPVCKYRKISDLLIHLIEINKQKPILKKCFKQEMIINWFHASHSNNLIAMFQQKSIEDWTLNSEHSQRGFNQIFK